MHYENYHWQDHAPDHHRRRADLALTFVFAVLFSIGSLGSLPGGHDDQRTASLPANLPADLDAVQVANDGEAVPFPCRG
ncbi:hypothetical protein [Pelagibius sp. 7325]|uniref:hypothetical protein n=1 Tax=Pelagibius sp. 7325 TaxID=3131994 RepID=UPI0030ECD54D